MRNLEGENNPNNKPKAKWSLFLRHILIASIIYPMVNQAGTTLIPYGVIHWVTSGLITLLLTLKGLARKYNHAYGNG